MKKYTLFLLIIAFALGLFGLFNINRASAVNCAPGDVFNSSTGQRCSTTTVIECSTGDLFSSITGQFCTVWQNNSGANQQFQIGARGSAVLALQQTLLNAGFSPGKIDGVYGRITDAAAKNYYIKYPLPLPCPPVYEDGVIAHRCNPLPIISDPVISGVSGPQSLEVNQQGTWTVKAYDRNGGNLSYSVVWGDEFLRYQNPSYQATAMVEVQSAIFTHTYSQAGTYTPTFTVSNTNGRSAQTSLSVRVGTVTPPSNYTVTVLSPNGGETWVKGTKQNITWQDTTDSKMCVNCTPTYTITLSHYYPPCTTNVCPMYPYRSPYTIATDVRGSSYSWNVGQVISTYNTADGSMASDGKYIIDVCQTGTSICDSSNSYFDIASVATNKNSFPIINGVPAIPTSIKVGESVTFSWHATDADNDDLKWGVEWGNGYGVDIHCITPSSNGQNWSYLSSNAWSQAGTYTIKATVSDCKGGINSRSDTVTVIGTTTQTPTISYLSQNPGAVNTQVTIYGSGFTSTGNRIKFGDLGMENNPRSVYNSDGNKIMFTVPTSNYMACWDSNPACYVMARQTAPGTYSVSVINANGTSNAVNFTVTQ